MPFLEYNSFQNINGELDQVGSENMVDKHAFYVYKFYSVGVQHRVLRNFTIDMQQQWKHWVVFGGIHRRADVKYMTTRAHGTLQLIQCLSIRHERILSSTSVKAVVF